jgi:hypothetical protein
MAVGGRVSCGQRKLDQPRFPLQHVASCSARSDHENGQMSGREMY